jgi:hypothetical protein
VGDGDKVRIEVFQHVADVIRAVTEMSDGIVDNTAGFVETGLRERDYVAKLDGHAPGQHLRTVRVDCCHEGWP